MYRSSVLPEDIEKLELAAFGGKIEVIDRPGPRLEHAIKYLSRQKIIGFDTESRPCFSPDQPKYGVSLLQLSGPKEAFLFRIKLLGLDNRLCRIMASEKIVKVGAAVHDDLRGLQRYCQFEPSNFIDLQKIVWEYGIKDKSVKKMSAIILGVRISKTQQLSNWEAEILSEQQRLYAATDAWICREMYNKLMKSEKNPLSEEEMHPHPAPVPPVEEVKVNAEETSQTPEEAALKAARRKKRLEKRRRFFQRKYRTRKTRNKSNGKDNTEKR